MMIGLPESTRQDEIKTAKDLIKLKPKMVRIYPVLVLKGTKLEKDYQDEKYKALTVVQAVEISKELVRMFDDKDIDIIRVGLQNTDEITDPSVKGSEVVAGPYHPAFGQLVEDAIWYDKIVDDIKHINAKVIRVEIEANSKDLNNIIGHKKENINKLKDTYAVITTVKCNNKIKPGKFKINVLETA